MRARIAYSSPLPPVGHHIWSAWTFQPVTTLALAAATGAVVLGACRLASAGDRWPWRRAASFCLGLLTAVIATDGWPAVYAPALLSVLASRQLTLLLVSPVFIAFSRPQLPLRALWPNVRLPHRLTRTLSALGHPLLTPLLIPVITAVLLFSPLLAAVVDHRSVSDVVDLTLLGLGILIAAPLARDRRRDPSLAVGVALFAGLFELLLDAIPGIVLRLRGTVLGPVHMLAARRSWGPSALHDQQLAGAIVWGLAELIDLPFLLIVIQQWVHADTSEARRIDQALDREQRIAELRAPVTVADDAGQQPPVMGPPWWETDPSVFGDARSSAFRANVQRADPSPPRNGD